MQDTMKNLVEFAMGKARETVLNEEEVIRVFFAKNRTNDVHVIMAPATGDENDDKYIPYLRVLFGILGIEAYCMMSEVWMSKRETREGPRPSQDPNRTEAIVAFAVQRAENDKEGVVTRFASAEITRDPTAVGPIKWEDLTHIESKWSSLLPPADLPDCPDIP